jgi:Peptidase M61 N-terminal domain
MTRRIALAVLAFCFALPVFAQTTLPITLTVDTMHSPEKILHVREVIPVHPGPMTLYYPKWIPGEHSPTGPLTALAGLHFSTNDKSVRGSAISSTSTLSTSTFLRALRNSTPRSTSSRRKASPLLTNCSC